MRTLNFIVEDQRLLKDPECDFTGIVRGTTGYLYCKFSFNDTWKDFTRVVLFTSRDEEEYERITDDGLVSVPDSMSNKPYFKVKVYGVNGNEKLVTTTEFITQERG